MWNVRILKENAADNETAYRHTLTSAVVAYALNENAVKFANSLMERRLDLLSSQAAAKSRRLKRQEFRQPRPGAPAVRGKLTQGTCELPITVCELG